MTQPQHNSALTRLFGYSVALTAGFSVAVITGVFVVGNLEIGFEAKAAIVGVMLIAYLVACGGFYYIQRERLAGELSEPTVFSDSLDAKLLMLEEANEFFGASLKFSDMFRLVASRVGEIVPFAACAIYVRGTGDKVLELKYVVGDNAQKFLNSRADVNKGLAVKALLSGKTQFDPRLLFEKRIFPADVVDIFSSAAAVPLRSRGEAFGVLVLYSNGAHDLNEGVGELLTAVAERVAPLFANSAAFEQNVANAMTDTLTNLPNERGFFLVLENQLAESVRNRDERPLSVLAMDIRGFDDVNQKYGHTTGDRLLAFASLQIKKQLRQMDVLTRSLGDEFLAVLPTASEKICNDVVDRIKRAFVVTQFELEPGHHINLEINFGAATFWKDGETAEHLLKTARIKKSHQKSPEPSKVIFFPKEFVN